MQAQRLIIIKQTFEFICWKKCWKAVKKCNLRTYKPPVHVASAKKCHKQKKQSLTTRNQKRVLWSYTKSIIHLQYSMINHTENNSRDEQSVLSQVKVTNLIPTNPPVNTLVNVAVNFPSICQSHVNVMSADLLPSMLVASNL